MYRVNLAYYCIFSNYILIVYSGAWTKKKDQRADLHSLVAPPRFELGTEPSAIMFALKARTEETCATQRKKTSELIFILWWRHLDLN